MIQTRSSGSPGAYRPGEPGSFIQAWDQARLLLCALDPVSTARRAGAVLLPAGLLVPHLARQYLVSLDSGAIRQADPPHAQADIVTSILVAHYLLAADGTPLAGELASYRDFPGAGIYYGPFSSRTIRRLARAFGASPGRLLLAGAAAGAVPRALGDAAVELLVLPRLPITYAVWAGDDEVPASAVVLFDRSAVHYLPLEDLVVAAGQGVEALIRAKQD